MWPRSQYPGLQICSCMWTGSHFLGLKMGHTTSHEGGLRLPGSQFPSLRMVGCDLRLPGSQYLVWGWFLARGTVPRPQECWMWYGSHYLASDWLEAARGSIPRPEEGWIWPGSQYQDQRRVESDQGHNTKTRGWLNLTRGTIPRPEDGWIGPGAQYLVLYGPIIEKG